MIELHPQLTWQLEGDQQSQCLDHLGREWRPVWKGTEKDRESLAIHIESDLRFYWILDYTRIETFFPIFGFWTITLDLDFMGDWPYMEL